ncbi:amidohydrolase family protein [Sphingopyxis sp. LARHCG72]
MMTKKGNKVLRCTTLFVLLAVLGSVTPVQAERPAVTEAMRPYVSEDAPVIALVHARVIDGTGAPAREGRTLILRNGNIEAVGNDGEVDIPAGAKIIDLTGKTVLPGLVHLHEHLWMFGGDAVLGVSDSYPRLYLAAGVTSIRTAGSYNPYIDLRARDRIEAGEAVGPWMDLSIYLDLFGAPRLADAEATRKYLNFWLDSGFTSVKAYGYTNRIALEAAIALAHARDVKVTGHLCMVSYREAAELGIDDIEHGFAMVPDFVFAEPARKRRAATKVDVQAERECGERALAGLADVDPRGREAKALIDTLVARRVAVTSTLPALEDLVSEIPPQTGIDMLAPPIRDYHRAYRARTDSPAGQRLVLTAESLRKTAVIEREFMKAGGLLVAGTDPAVPSAGVVAGYSNARQLELMVEFGFTPLEAIRVSTLNGAIYLGRDKRVGSIAPNKQADLLIVSGDPSRTISDIRNVFVVFKQGIGYDPAKLRESVRGKVGLM